MSYELFCSKVTNLVEKLGLTVSFSEGEGKHYARVSDGTQITGNSTSARVEIRWGSGHKALASI